MKIGLRVESRKGLVLGISVASDCEGLMLAVTLAGLLATVAYGAGWVG